MQKVIGIDPGLKGAAIFLDQDGHIRDTELMTTFAESPASFFEFLSRNKPAHVFLEKAQSMPKQGVTSMFSYGQGFGRIMGWLDSTLVPYTLISPIVWTKVMHRGCDGHDAKAKSKQAAQRLFPHEDFVADGCRTMHMGLVDAALIAKFGQKGL